MKTLSKRIIILFSCLLFLVSVLGCGDSRVINNVKYETYGLLNQDSKKDTNIKYEIIWGNVIWGCILVETVVAPVYFFGFSIFEPIGEK